MNKILELSEELIKVLNFICDSALKNPQCGGMQAHDAVQYLKQSILQAPSKEEKPAEVKV